MLDAFVGSTFNQSGAQSFLNASIGTHESDNYVTEFAVSKLTRTFFIQDGMANSLVQLQSDGNVLLLDGSLQQNQSSIGVTSASELVLKDSNGQIFALIDNANGNFKLKSNHVVDETLQSTTASELIVRNTTDSGYTAQIILTGTGQLRTRGDVFSDNDL